MSSRTLSINESGCEGKCPRNDSVYGAALALPQVARTAGWSLEYTSLACHRSSACARASQTFDDFLSGCENDTLNHLTSHHGFRGMMFLLTNLLLQGFLLYMLSKELRTLESRPDSDLSGRGFVQASRIRLFGSKVP